ncbi:MAG: hypothetical protein AAGJ40_02020 [Planctomycetota bacterium]
MHNRNDRVIRAIVAAGSLLAVVVVGLNLVDEYRHQRDEQSALADLEARLVNAQSRDARLKLIEGTLQEERDRLVSQSTTPSQIQQVRDQVLQIVQQTSVKLRSLDVGEGQSRPWAHSGDDPSRTQLPEFDNESDFELHSHVLTLTADAPLANIMAFMDEFNGRGWLMNVNALEMKHMTDDDRIALNLEWTLYGLMEAAVDPTDDLDDQILD